MWEKYGALKQREQVERAARNKYYVEGYFNPAAPAAPISGGFDGNIGVAGELEDFKLAPGAVVWVDGVQYDVGLILDDSDPQPIEPQAPTANQTANAPLYRAMSRTRTMGSTPTHVQQPFWLGEDDERK